MTLLTCRSRDDDALLFTFYSQQSVIYTETETKQERRRVVIKTTWHTADRGYHNVFKYRRDIKAGGLRVISVLDPL